MAEKINRLGYLGLAIEAVSGSAESSPDVFIPYTENSLRGHHEPLRDISARASRVSDYGSVGGKRWGEGSVNMYLDGTNSGYVLKMALGIESNTEVNASPAIRDHLFTPTVSGNAATTATLWDYKGFDVERYIQMAVDVLEVEVTNDGIATVNTSLMGRAPETVTAPTLATVSGTLFTWKDLNAYFGDTVQTLANGSAIPLTNLKFTISNNVEIIYESGSQTPTTVVTRQLEAVGSYTLYFESATDRDRYYNLTKKSMLIRMSGASLGAGYTERLDFIFNRVHIEDIDLETGLDDLFAITCNFRGEFNQDQPGFIESRLRNGKVADY